MKPLLLVGYSGASPWASAIIVALQLLLFGLILRTWIAPFILKAVSKRIRIGSISLRSVRRLYVRTKSMTIRIDRIGISYHNHFSANTRRFSLKIEGLQVELHATKVEGTELNGSSGLNIQKRPRNSRKLTFSLFTRAFWSLYSAGYALLEPLGRPLIRACFVTSVRIIIRCLPALTQVFDVEISNALISLTTSPGAHIAVRGMTLSGAVAFSAVEDVIALSRGSGHGHSTRRYQGFLNMAHMRFRLRASARRALERAWGRTKGRSTFIVQVQEMSGFSDEEGTFSEFVRCLDSSLLVAERYAFVTQKDHRNALCIVLPRMTEFTTTFDFGPRKGILEERSLATSLKISKVEISQEPMKHFIRAIDSTRSDVATASNDKSPTLKSPTVDNVSASSVGPLHGSFQYPLFRTAELLVGNLTVRNDAPRIGGLEKICFRSEVRDLFCSISIEEDSEEPFHRDILGKRSKEIPSLDADVLSQRFSIGKIAVYRYDLKDNLPSSKIISIGQVNLQGFATQWNSLMLDQTRQFSGDANASVLAVKLEISGPQFNERIDVVDRILDDIRSNLDEDHRRPGGQQLLRSVPRIRFDMSVNDVAACLISRNNDTGHSSTLVLSSTQSHMSLSTSFRNSFAKSDHHLLQRDKYIPLEILLSIESVLGPAIVSILPEALSLDQPLHRTIADASSFGEQLLTLGLVEMSLSGRALGVSDDDAVIIDLSSSLMDLQCKADALSVELWQSSAVSSLRFFLRSIKAVRDKPRSEAKGKELLDVLPFGLSIQLAIGQVGCLISGKDLNPEENLGLSRGITMSSGLSAQLCTTHDRRKTARLPRHSPHAHNRQRLRLSEDMITRTKAAANTLADHDMGRAHLRCVAFDTVVRSAQCKAQLDTRLSSGDEDLLRFGACRLITIDRLEVNVVIHRTLPDHGKETDRTTAEITAGVHNLQARLQLSDFYCLFLATATISSLIKAVPTSRAGSSSRSPYDWRLLISLNTAQCLLKLPLDEELCLRIDKLRLKRKIDENVFISWVDLLLWVPTSRGAEKWEELARFRSWTVTLVIVKPQPFAVHVDAEVARVSVPYGYVVADLMLNFNLLFKCLRHLQVATSAGLFYPVPAPESEMAKYVPPITLKIKLLSAEAADDPLESKLGLIWRAGLKFAHSRLERDEAFNAKVEAIKAAETGATNEQTPAGSGRFTPQHTVSIEEAHDRLLQVHSISWISLHREFREGQKRLETSDQRRIRGDGISRSGSDIKPMVPLSTPPKLVPLLRIILNKVHLNVTKAFNETGELTAFMQDVGNGVPRDTQFSLLIPLHLRLELGTSSVTLRDYPLPLLTIKQDEGASAAWCVETHVVLAEELGSSSSVIWKDCPISFPDLDPQGNPLVISIPKTAMPVKTYMNPSVNVFTSRLTEFCWCISYSPAIQDMMRVLDTLSTPPPDPSPPMGFWDKIKLQFHCRADIAFAGEVNLYLKGSRDPYETEGIGAGFALCWNGNTQMTIGRHNPERELLQVISDTMLIAIPDFRVHKSEEFLDMNTEPHFSRASHAAGRQKTNRRFLKVCAKFTSGIRWGIGAIMERTCGVNCRKCNNTSACRLFEFRPHYDVVLEPKPSIPEEKTSADSFNEFRSDFVHLSTSLASPVRLDPSSQTSNSFHLTPKVFAHFWSWWNLFDRSLALPVRQGKLFPNARPPSKKFGRHLATLKYRLAVSKLFISHVYTDDSRESWADGVTNLVGLKALVSSFEADMHQREQEVTIPDVAHLTLKKVRHKPFYAAEVKLMGLEVQAILATFLDPLKCSIDLGEHERENRFSNAETISLDAGQRHWIDMDDFEETDWTPADDNPSLHIFRIGSCPRFSYFRRSSGNLQQARPGLKATQAALERSRFGDEDTHVCLMGKEPSVRQLQSHLISERIEALEHDKATRLQKQKHGQLRSEEVASIEKKVTQLRRHLQQLRDLDNAPSQRFGPSLGDYPSYLMPIDVSSPADWTEFDNVYQFHCPKFYLNNCVREILTQYYYCSRARRGFEYHLATRAVKFIRDQANAYTKASGDTNSKEKRYRNTTGAAAQAAALALKRILIGNEGEDVDIRGSDIEETEDETFNPMEGWSDGVSLKKSHFCLLLKPQVLLSETSKDSVVILTAVQAVLQSCDILDTVNAEDPISGRVMTRSHAALFGLQAFSPSISCPIRHDGVPLEVLIDLRAESDHFERLVPQTRATFRYDKFNRLRLRNSITSVTDKSADHHHAHLQHQTDLVDIKVPRFTVSADSRNFESITNIITDLLLQSDSAHKLHLNKVETLLFNYDFTDFSSSADVVEGLQDRLRRTVERAKGSKPLPTVVDEREQIEQMALKARIFLVSEELNYIFDAIKLAQDKADDKHSDTKSALQVRAWSKEISWDMVNDVREIIAKLAVRGVDYSWLNRQDGSTVNRLTTTDLQAFDGSKDAEWPEVLVKYREPMNHPLVKMGIFLQADWTVLAPVGGIAIYEAFVVRLHPMRLQLEARIGKSIMEYVWPARRNRLKPTLTDVPDASRKDIDDNYLVYDSDPSESTSVLRRASVDMPGNLYRRPSQGKRHSDETRTRLSSKRMTASRSFTDLRSSSRQNSQTDSTPRTGSEASGTDRSWLTDRSGYIEPKTPGEFGETTRPGQKEQGDAAEMKSRSLQKHFVHVYVSSMHIILSFHKDGSFFCRDARIQTRELEFRNRTFSFEELAEQFIPSDTSWRGWMRMALHQPLVPVLPVARELFSKTKWITAKGKSSKKSRARITAAESHDAAVTEGQSAKLPDIQRFKRSSDKKR